MKSSGEIPVYWSTFSGIQRLPVTTVLGRTRRTSDTDISAGARPRGIIRFGFSIGGSAEVRAAAADAPVQPRRSTARSGINALARLRSNNNFNFFLPHLSPSEPLPRSR